MDSGRDRSCDRCGYDLVGLARQGRCPECGQYFDVYSGEGLYSGVSARHRRGHRLMARLRTVLIALATVMVMVCGGLMSFVARNPARAIGIASVIAAVGVLAAITSFVCEKDEG